MAKYLIDESTVTSIANTIRELTDSENSISGDSLSTALTTAVSNKITPQENCFIFDDYDIDGYPTTLIIQGFTFNSKQIFFNITIGSGGGYFEKIKTIKYINCTGILQSYCAGIWSNAQRKGVVENVDVCEGITEVFNYTFRSTDLKKVIFRDNIKLLQYMFYGCTNLKKLIFKKNITTWPMNIFAASNAQPDLYDFSKCENIFTLPATDTSTFPNAVNCKILIPYNLYAPIDSNNTAWQNETNWTALTNVIWVGVSNEQNVVYDLTRLANMWEPTSVEDVPHATNCVIKVPQELLIDYQAANIWSTMNDIVWEGVPNE